ncbi:MAG: DAK2 domain-containing protein [Ruminococcaceae bacterium]|nr:DAK2 domain-containing protein [Oscillospiraceae bacterium]
MEKKNKKDNKDAPTKKRGITTLDGLLFKEMVAGGANELSSNVEEINRLNVFPVPDGDTGDNMLSTVNSGVRAIEGLDTDNLAEVMRVLSHGMLLGARGNSGVILSQFFKGVADGFENSKNADPKTLGSALELGVKEAYATVTTPTEGTILTVAREAVEYAVSKINPKTTIKSFFGDFVKELHASVERTPESLPALKEAGVVDSGGAGLFYLMDGFNRVLKGEKQASKYHNEGDCAVAGKEKKDSAEAFSKTNKAPPDNSKDDTKDIVKTSDSAFDENTDMNFAYCTELLVQLTRAKCDTDSFDIDDLRAFLCSVGDSAIALKHGSVVKIHVHTFSPDKVLSHMLNFGEFINTKIENMSLQHTEIAATSKKNDGFSEELFTNNSFYSDKESIADKNTACKRYGIVAACNGEGMKKLFRELGADEIIPVDSGINPSADDFLKSAERIGASEVFILPNNSNFILSAEQAAKMESDFKIHVIPSKDIALGYAALSVINLENESSEEILRSAARALNNTSSGSVFTAAKDAKCSGLKIKCGEKVGAIGKDIVAKGKSAYDCAIKICKRLMQNKFVLTVFSGKEAKRADTLLIEKKIKKLYPESEIYVIDSGQSIFEYIFAAE